MRTASKSVFVKTRMSLAYSIFLIAFHLTLRRNGIASYKVFWGDFWTALTPHLLER